jgi:Flp pilus assembly protein TadD
MHRIRQWMSSVALVTTAGLVVVAARQHLSSEDASPAPIAAPVSEPPRLAALPLPTAASDGAWGELSAGTARVTQHTYPIREPSAEPRQPWKGELPLADMLPERNAASRPPVSLREPEAPRRAQPAKKKRPAAPVVEEYAEEAAEAYEEEVEVAPPPVRRKRIVRQEPALPDEAEEQLPVEVDPAPRSRRRVAPPAPVAEAQELPAEPYEAPLPAESQPARMPPVARMAQGQIDVNSPAMRAVQEKAREHTRHGFSLAQRGATFSARAEFIQSLRLVAQAMDTQSGGDQFGRSLAAGLQALEEADDFAPKGSKLEAHLPLAALVDAHETPVLKNLPIEELNPLQALQHYYAYAREQLAYATGRTVAGSEALYALGKLQTQAVQLEAGAERMHQAKGMAFHQAALDADSRNYQAANELAVLLARHGQWETAKTLLVHSVQLKPQPEVWRNLATVHATLGEQELARLAENECRLMQPDGPAHPLAGQVQWVDPAAFAAAGPQGGPAPRMASQPRPQPRAPQPASSTGNWITPWTSFLR